MKSPVNEQVIHLLLGVYPPVDLFLIPSSSLTFRQF
jgi:hypothetical protein